MQALYGRSGDFVTSGLDLWGREQQALTVWRVVPPYQYRCSTAKREIEGRPPVNPAPARGARASTARVAAACGSDCSLTHSISDFSKADAFHLDRSRAGFEYRTGIKSCWCRLLRGNPARLMSLCWATRKAGRVNPPPPFISRL